MARDITLEQKIETVLYTCGVRDSGHVAQEVVALLNRENRPAMTEHVTPMGGDLTGSEHSGFMLRVFMHLVAISEKGELTVDLRDVLESTTDKTMVVSLDGPRFTARAFAIPVVKQ